LEKLMTIQETAQMLRISPVTLRLWTYQKRVQSVKLGRRVLFRKTDIDNFINSNLRKKEG
jgi:excisionase family DNA binding protein